MPRYFFDFFDGHEWSEDSRGIELPSTEQAWLEAHAGARSMWSELVADRFDPLACAFEVRGEHGRALFRFGFPELLDHCKDSPAAARPDRVCARTIAETHRRASAARSDLRASFDEVRRSLDEARALLAYLGTLERGRVDPHRARPPIGAGRPGQLTETLAINAIRCTPSSR